MTAIDLPGPAACGACGAAPIKAGRAGALADQEFTLALPQIHCAACISSVEEGLRAHDGIRSVRVNLAQKRVKVGADTGVDIGTVIDWLADLGVPALELGGDLSALGPARQVRGLVTRVAVAGFANMNVMLLSVAVWSGAGQATAELFHWISALIALPALIYAAQPFFSSAFNALRKGRTNMDVPISVAIILSSSISLFETRTGGGHAWFDAALSLTFFLLIGRWLDERSRSAARSAAAQLAALEVPRILKRFADGPRLVPQAEVMAGDVVLVRPGARLPVDGHILAGESDVDPALLTGESLPRSVRIGDSVHAGEINGLGQLEVSVEAVGKDTVLRQMAGMIDEGERIRNRYTALADRVARFYTPLVHSMALMAFTAWYVSTGDVHRSISVAAAVLIITCPCALGLAVPAVATAAAAVLFRRGVLVTNGSALERLAEVDCIVFDKTGTLTESQLRLAGDDLPPHHASIALALAQGSTHPVARAVARGLAGLGHNPAHLVDLTEESGGGVAAQFAGETVRLGSARFVGAGADRAGTVWLGIGDVVHPLQLTARLRPGVREALRELTARGFDIHLISGDLPDPVAEVAETLGIAEAHAGMRPADKCAYLADLAAHGHRVLMVGDGLNDAPALALAHASVAPAEAADVARVAADVVLLAGGLSELPALLSVARRARSRAVENFAIAAVYNVVSVPLAFAGIATPLMAALAMSTSSITVLLNALRVRP